MSSLIDDWNAALRDMVKLVDDHNAAVKERYEKGEISSEAAMASLEPRPEPIQHPTESWVRAWKRNWGWAMLGRSSDDSSWLPYHHSDMEVARTEVKKLVSEHGCHKWLLLNFDQIWRNCWSLSKTPLFYKSREQAGQRAKKAKVGARIDKKLHSIRGARRSITVSWLHSG
jgi:hypothetical protein